MVDALDTERRRHCAADRLQRRQEQTLLLHCRAGGGALEDDLPEDDKVDRGRVAALGLAVRIARPSHDHRRT